MQVREIMTPDLKTIEADASIREAAAMMRDLDVGMVPVAEQGRLVGTLTDRDITIHATAAGRDPGNTPVREAMSADVIYVFDDEDVQTAARAMESKQIRRVLVFNRSKEPVGIIATKDLVTDTGDTGLSGEVLYNVSQG